MKKTRISIFLMMLLTSIYLINSIVSGDVSMYDDNFIKENHNLKRGTILLGAHSRQGFRQFYPGMRDKLIQDYSFFPFGWGPFTPKEGEYDWSEMDELIDEAKKQDAKFATAFWSAAHSYEHSPHWLYYEYNLRMITSQGAFVNFENKNNYRGFTILPAGRVTENENEVLSQKKSLHGENGVFLSSENIMMKKQFPNSLGFDYKVLQDGEFKIILENTDGTQKILWEDALKKDTAGSKMIWIPSEELSNYKKIIWVAQRGSISVDNVNVSPMIPGVHGVPVAYPNYFDPIFKEKYENFVHALYKQYKDEPAMAAVYVGGYGRWDEVGIDAGFMNEAVEDLYLVNEQWLSYGYSDDKYLDHVKWCADLFDEVFGESDKDVIMQSIAFDVPGDTSYMNWEVINYAAGLGFGIKVNGLSEMVTEFNQDTNQYFWLSSRYKNILNFYHEQGTQVNNMNSDIVGHPLSLVNRLIIDAIDYFWVYPIDIYDPYVRKYLHYANEQAGSALVNKMYSIMGSFSYYSNNAKMNFEHKNLWTGIYTKNSVNLEFGDLDGVNFVKTTQNEKSVILSIDDRQKWRGMYGNTLTIDYYDSGNEDFTIKVMVPDGSVRGTEKILGTVTRSSTDEWKSVSFYDSEFVNDKRSGGLDMPAEIIIESGENEPVKISNVELNYVPVSDYRKDLIFENPLKSDSILILERDPVSFEIDIPEGSRIAEIQIPLTELDGKVVNVEAVIYSIDSDGNESMLVEKNMFKPGRFVYLPIPVSHADFKISKYRVELSVRQGSAGAYKNENGNIAYRLYAFSNTKAQVEEIYEVKESDQIVEALTDFAGIKLSGMGSGEFNFSKILPDGRELATLFTTELLLDGEENWFFEPQTSGIYKISFSGDVKNLKLETLPLVRILSPKEPVRYNLGTQINNSFSENSKDLWIVESGLKNVYLNDGSFTALLDGKNPSIITQKELAIEATRQQIFNFIMKNETASPLTKLYWKTIEEDFFSENKSVIIPTVANDSKFREYSWPIGNEKSWKGVITGLKFVPVSGHTQTGRISIHNLSIREDSTADYEKYELLDIKSVKPDSTIYIQEQKKSVMPVLVAVITGFIAIVSVLIYFLVRKRKLKA